MLPRTPIESEHDPRPGEQKAQGEDLRADVLARRLAYAGYVLVAYELVKSIIVGPIKAFYADTTFGQGVPFKSHDEDVRSRHKNEFEACLLYLRDFMEALDADGPR